MWICRAQIQILIDLQSAFQSIICIAYIRIQIICSCYKIHSDTVLQIPNETRFQAEQINNLPVDFSLDHTQSAQCETWGLDPWFSNKNTDLTV